MSGQAELAVLIAGDGITTREQAGVGAQAIVDAGWADPRTHRLIGDALGLAIKQREKAEAKAEKAKAETLKARQREIAVRSKAFKFDGETEQVRRLAEDVLTLLDRIDALEAELRDACKPDHVVEAERMRKEREG